MLEADFRELVDELEDSAHASQATYRLKVAVLAALGYIYVIAVVALLAGAVWMLALAMKDGRHLGLLKLAIPMALLAAVGAKALWVRLEPPEGMPVTAAEAPNLFKLIERVRKRLKGPPIHHVLMDAQYNASIVQLPRFGLFGGSRNYLVVGLPLIQTLTVEQFAAVLAHEYGHLSGAHGHFAAWIYRVRMTWARILDSLANRPTWGSGLFLHFFRWYVPYFQAYTFVLARSNEYEADRASADLVGARTTADALAQVELGARFVEEHFWPRFESGADRSPVPAFLPHAQLPISMDAGLEAAQAQAWLKAALKVKTDVADTHPSLADRLQALEQDPRLPEPSGPNAAKALLATHLAAVVKHFDKAWARESLATWRERHAEAQALKARAAQVTARFRSGASLGAAEWYDVAQACERFSSEEKAQEYYRRAIDADPHHHESHLGLGALLIKRRDANGIAHLDKALPAGGRTALEAAALAARFLREAGREREAERYEVKAMAQSAQEEQKAFGRVFLLPEDDFAPHGLTPKELGLCRASFKRSHRIHAVHAARKILKETGESYLVFLVQPRVGPFAVVREAVLGYLGMHPGEDMSAAEDLLRLVRLEAPYSAFVDLYLDDEVVRKVQAIEGSLVFDESHR